MDPEQILAIHKLLADLYLTAETTRRDLEAARARIAQLETPSTPTSEATP